MEEENFVTRLAISPDQAQVLVHGSVRAGSSFKRYLIRLNGNGSLDETFNFDPITHMGFMVYQPDGKILVPGATPTPPAAYRDAHILRLNPDGTLDESFKVFLEKGEYPLSASWVQVDEDGSILIAGFFDRVNGVHRPGIARLLPDDCVDLSFGPVSGLDMDTRLSLNYSQYISRVIKLPDDSLLIGGLFFIQAEGQANYHLAK
jgi:uncharacterized delta-60 repeat protein